MKYKPCKSGHLYVATSKARKECQFFTSRKNLGTPLGALQDVLKRFYNSGAGFAHKDMQRRRRNCFMNSKIYDHTNSTNLMRRTSHN